MHEDSFTDKTKSKVERFVTVLGDKRGADKLTALLQIERELRDIVMKQGNINDINKFTTPEEKLYGMVNDAIVYERKIPLTFEQDISYIVGQVTNPTSMPSKNLLSLVELTKAAMNQIKINQSKFKEGSKGIVDEFLKSQGFAYARIKTIGDQANAYKNLFVQSNGDIDSRLTLKNPYDPTSQLSPAERKFSIYFLDKINKLRFGTSDPMSEVGLQKQDTQEWFQVPLLRGSAVTKMINKNVSSGIKEWYNGLLNINNIFDQDKTQVDRYANGMFEMFNSFEFHSDMEGRNKLIQEETLGSFETNLETVLDTFVFAYNRQEEYNKILPVVNALKVAMSWQAFELNIELPNAETFIKEYVKSSIYSDNSIYPGIEALHQGMNAIKQVASIANIGLNPITGVMALFQGQWGNLTRLMSRSYGENMFGKGDYFSAVKFMTGLSDTVENHGLADAFNMEYGLNNMDVNMLPELMTRNRGGLLGFRSGGMYWTSSAPDYFNRMLIFIAQMKHDGCFDAHSVVDGALVYDFKKDKRFSEYAAGHTSSPEYGKQKALYDVMRADFNKYGENIMEGDALPRAYNLKQRESLKMFADGIHGYYDHETKIMFNNNIVGMMFLQFKRWLTSKKDQYILKPGSYAQGDYVQLEVDGHKYYVDGNGEHTTTDTGNPVMIWKGKYMEGILVSMAHMFTEVAHSENKVDTFWNLLKDRPERTANMKLLAWDMGIVSCLMMIAGLIDWPSIQKDDEYAAAIYKAVLRSGNDLNVFSLVGTGLSAEPFAALSYGKDVKDSFLKAVSGNESVGKAITANIGFARPFAPLFTNN